MANAIPVVLAEAVDLYHETRQKRLDMQKAVDAVEEFEKSLQRHIIAALKARGATALGGKKVCCAIKESYEPQVEDWDAVRAHIMATGEWELLQKRIGDGAVKERWENDQEVPGVGRRKVEKLSTTRVAL